jgi:ABC-type phosphate/phosphonate transport system substrate-binding protein
MTLRVSLPMYNLPEMRSVNAAFWLALRTELEGEVALDLPSEPDYSRAPVPGAIEPETLFTQVCGYPLQTIYAGQATWLAVPVYDAPHCEGPNHAGVFLVAADSPMHRLEDLRGRHFAFNSLQSNSGMNLPRRALAEIAAGAQLFASIVETHSQPGNIERVARGEVEATCVDCVTYAFFRRHRPALAERTRVLAATPPSPAIPFVTGIGTPPDVVAALRAALSRVARAPRWAEARAGLMIADILPVDPARYSIQMDYEREAAALGYPALA